MGHVVAPGFIDMQNHYLRPWSNKLALRDGRTSLMDLELGTHGPYISTWYAQRTGAGADVPDEASSGDATSIDQLTNREIDVLELLARRFSNKEIAHQLGVSASTIKMHTLNIYRKLGVKGRRQAAAEAMKRDVLAP